MELKDGNWLRLPPASRVIETDWVLGDLCERPSDDGGRYTSVSMGAGLVYALAVRVQQTARNCWKLQDTSKKNPPRKERPDGIPRGGQLRDGGRFRHFSACSPP